MTTIALVAGLVAGLVAAVPRPQGADVLWRIFVAGGTGVIGRALIPELVAAGHSVDATTRAPDRSVVVESLGAKAVIVDPLDDRALYAAVRESAPDVVMNQLTSLPKRYNPRRLGPSYAATARLRVEATRTLLQAAEEAGATRFIFQSIAFMYDSQGPPVLAEDSPLAVSAPEPFGALVHATAAGEPMTTDCRRLTGVALRYGQLYGPGTYYAADGGLRAAGPTANAPDHRRRRRHLLNSYTSKTSRPPHSPRSMVAPGVFNIVDDQPAPARDWVPALCRDAGAPQPPRLPTWVARLVAGPLATAFMTSGRGAANAKARRELAWSPSRPTWQAGFL